LDNLLNPANAHQQRCPRCQSPLNTVVVHGHEQCVICKSNIFECCSGDTCNTDHNLNVGYKRGWCRRYIRCTKLSVSSKGTLRHTAKRIGLARFAGENPR